MGQLCGSRAGTNRADKYKVSGGNTLDTKQKTQVNNKQDLKLNREDMIIQSNTNRIFQDYHISHDTIGEGAFGAVYHAKHKISGQNRAIKVINRDTCDQEEEDLLINEVMILKKLTHPNIIQVFEFAQTDERFYIVTEYCKGGELFDRIIEQQGFAEQDTIKVVKQILGGICYCHNQNIVHRDLKPENILYVNRNKDSPIKIIDFGTSKVFDPSKHMSQRYGTPYYIAPEVLKKEYDHKCDIWSIGVMTYIMICGYPPFNAKDDQDIMNKVRIGKFQFPDDEWENISDSCKNFIRRMLILDPKQRCSAMEALQDPWLTEGQKNTFDKKSAAKALQNIKSFRSNFKLQEATWTFLCTYMASKEDKEKLNKIFKALDTNGDGLISLEELLAGYNKCFDLTISQTEIKQIFEKIDTDKSGTIDYSEFIKSSIDRKKMLSKKRLERVFKMFDKDGSGSISSEELRQIFGANQDVSNPMWDELIKEADEDGNGEIDLQEFKTFMMKLQ